MNRLGIKAFIDKSFKKSPKERKKYKNVSKFGSSKNESMKRWKDEKVK